MTGSNRALTEDGELITTLLPSVQFVAVTVTITVTIVSGRLLDVVVDISTLDHLRDVQADSIQYGSGLSIGIDMFGSETRDGSRTVSKLRDKDGQDH